MIETLFKSIVPPADEIGLVAREQVSAIKRFVSKPRIVVDCGAHYGDHSLLYSEDRECAVYSIEPNPITFRQLALRTMGRRNVVPCPIALSKEDGISRMYFSCPSTLATLDARWMTEVFPDQFSNAASFEVPTMNWLSFCKVFGIEDQSAPPDILKIDAEGLDEQIVGNVLLTGPVPKVIQLEAERQAPDHFKLVNRLTQCGFRMVAEYSLDGARGYFDEIWTRI